MVANAMKEMEAKIIVIFRYLFLITQNRNKENSANSKMVNKLNVINVSVGYLFDL